jgi:hypothetical protein
MPQTGSLPINLVPVTDEIHLIIIPHIGYMTVMIIDIKASNESE